MTKQVELVLEMKTRETIRTDILDTFIYKGKQQFITYETHEFSAVCPFSGLPDIATVRIQYVPTDKCLELKSLKLYFISFRQVGMYQEHVTNRIHSDIWEVLSPAYLRIETIYATRGGIDATCCITQGNLPSHFSNSDCSNISDHS